MEIPKNSIQDNPYLVHFEIWQKMEQNEEQKGQKETFEGQEQRRGPKGGAPSNSDSLTTLLNTEHTSVLCSVDKNTDINILQTVTQTN